MFSNKVLIFLRWVLLKSPWSFTDSAFNDVVRWIYFLVDTVEKRQKIISPAWLT